MNTRQYAQALGRRGGLARAKRLSAEQRKKIASMGGQSKALSAKAVQRIEINFIYLKAVKELSKTPRPESVSCVEHSLPGTYAKAE